MSAIRRAERRGDYAHACALLIRRDILEKTLDKSPRHTAKKRDFYQPRKTLRIRWAEVAATTAVSALVVAFAVTAYNLATDEPQPSCEETIAAWGTAEETRVDALVTAESYGSLQSLEAQDAWDAYYARVTLADIAHARYILACNASDAEFMELLDSRVEGR